MNDKLVQAALASDHFSRSVYLGKITQTEKVTIFLDDGTAVEKEVTFYLTWDSISALLGLVRERAGL